MGTDFAIWLTQVQARSGRYFCVVILFCVHGRKLARLRQVGRIAFSWGVDVLGLAVVAVGLYVLSLGPVLRYVGGPFHMPPSLDTFYHPLGLMLEQNGKPAVILRTYINFCGVRNNPQTGELLD